MNDSGALFRSPDLFHADAEQLSGIRTHERSVQPIEQPKWLNCDAAPHCSSDTVPYRRASLPTLTNSAARHFQVLPP